jgi:ribosomal protein L37AE/L43A
MSKSANCPKCGRKSHTPADGKDQWYCHGCKLAFEAIDDGTITYGRPEKRLEKAEAQHRFQQAKRNMEARKTRKPLRGGLG